MGEKNNKFMDLHFFIRFRIKFCTCTCYGKQKSLRIVEKKQYSGKTHKVTVPNEATLQAVIGSSRVSG